MPRAPESTRVGFTIVEMIVVIAILSVLVAILVPALSGVRRRALKAEETNNIRQVGTAWHAYSGNHNDACLPGYMTTRVQQRWKIAVEYPDQTDVPPAPGYSDGNNVAGPWTWRLLPYIGYNLEIIRSHLRDDTEMDTSYLQDERGWMTDKTLAVALEPAFGYNGFYLGGYWEQYEVGGSPKPRPRFFDVTDSQNRPVVPLATNMGSIKRSSEMVAFCSSSERGRPGIYTRRDADMAPGSHLVTPPFLGETAVWQRPGAGFGGGGVGDVANASGSVYDVETLISGVHAPLGRYNGQAALFFADGHTGTDTATGLFDQRRWLNETREVDGVLPQYFQHLDSNWRPVD